MSFLAPLFLVGALAVALPIVFHLIRRTSRERTLFSSLMFLLPTPPRVTRRSRLENIVLLILRCLVLCLLALGFARPLIQQALDDRVAEGPGRRVVLLVDTSASMKRDDLWPQAQVRAAEVLKKTSPADRVAVFTFDRQVNRLVTFDQWSAMNAAERADLARQRLAQTAPGWSATRLGHALVTAAEALEEVGGDRQATATGPRQVVLLTDLQEGSRLDALQAYEWPKGVELIVEPVKAKRPTNAGLQLITDRDETDRQAGDAGVRVRVSNAAESKREQFQVGWARAGQAGFAGAAVDVYVPPGQSRVVAVPLPPTGAPADRVTLRGDDEEFDNTVFVVPPEAARANVLFLGNEDEKDPAQLLYYLKRAFQRTRRQIVQVLARPADAPLLPADTASTALIVATDPLPEERVTTLRRWLGEGRSVLFVMKSAASAPALARLLGQENVIAEEAAVEGYALLGEIDFQHPLLAPFADPRFSDFTKIHFWKHRRLDPRALPGARVLARFDKGGEPALVEVAQGRGRGLVLTAGWHPADSQLALSSKFVPLLYSVLEQSGGVAPAPAQHLVGDAVPLAASGGETNGPVTLRKPDGSPVALAAGTPAFLATDQPGIYAVTAGQASRQFAVNLDPAESRTAPLPTEELERLGVPLKTPAFDAARLAEQKRHLRHTELENRQKLWRWLLVAALVVLLVETWLAGWLTRRAATAPPPAA
jgi:hypothetical protein